MHVAGVSVRRLVPEKRRDRDDRHLAGRRGRSDNRRERVPALDPERTARAVHSQEFKMPGLRRHLRWPLAGLRGFTRAR
jgi:hypothetical protein